MLGQQLPVASNTTETQCQLKTQQYDSGREDKTVYGLLGIRSPKVHSPSYILAAHPHTHTYQALRHLHPARLPLPHLTHTHPLKEFLNTALGLLQRVVPWGAVNCPQELTGSNNESS